MTEREAYVSFNLTDQVGSVTVGRLIKRYGSVVDAWEAYPRKVSRAGGPIDAAGELARAESFGVRVLTCADGDYPKMLREAPGHPLVLYVKGDVAALDRPAIAIVGTRRATQYGLDQAHLLAQGLAANGWCIISGLAVGIDAEAHRGALEAKGTTVGVIGSGLDAFYPEENRDLAREIVRSGGAVVSEFPFGRSADQHTFPQRNHVVAALARGVLAVEAPAKSGTLITTAAAADLGRTVMAVPGRIDSRASFGCLGLIREGAALVRNVRDIEQEMGELLPRPVRTDESAEAAETKRKAAAPVPPCSIEEALIMRQLDAEGISMDELARRSGLPIARVNALCMALRIRGRIRFLPGNRVTLPRSE